jgi:type IX secretion system substrate protein
MACKRSSVRLRYAPLRGSPDYEEILEIAHQCPYAGGSAVYQARMYVEMFYNTIEYDDQGTCLQCDCPMINKKSNLKIAGIFILPAIFTFFNVLCSFSQGLNHNYLIGYDTGLFDTNVTSTKARLFFDNNTVTVFPETRKLAFMAAQGNISDENGNLILSTNGCWIANGTGDTIINGSGLNPGQLTDDWCLQTSGIPFPHADIILPMPGDTGKYILFHQTGNYNLGGMATEVYYSLIDINLDSVIQKNILLFNDTLVPGMAACKHANGRDWWIVSLKDSSDLIYKILLTPNGIDTITSEHLNVFPWAFNNVNQPTFSPDGNKFAYTFTNNSGSVYHDVRLLNFDRCTGVFSNPQVADISDGYIGLGIAFSPSSKYLYATSDYHVFQFNTDSNNISAGMQIVATNDGYYSPHLPLQTDFWLMYLAANGKIYISSGNGVIDMHFMNYLDSGGIACDVQQHALHLPCYYARGNVYHPNYYLGCDTTSSCPCLTTGVNNLSLPDFRFRIYPNPVVNNILNIGYLLPQNKSGLFQIFDITGKVVFKYTLPPWSNEQSFLLPELSDGVYNCVITTDKERVCKKIAVVSE